MQQFKLHPMVSKQDLLKWSGVPRSSFYYKRGDGISGRKPSEMTITQDGELVENTVVLQDVEALSSKNFAAMAIRISGMCSRVKDTLSTIRKSIG